MRKANFFLAVAIVIAASCNNNRGYKNVALMKAASHSSAWDLNQTAQLVTDGLLAEKPAPWTPKAECL